MSFNGDGRARLVHEARKTIKRMRALARLLRPQIGDAEFRRVDESLGHAGQRLAGARDAKVLVATLQGLRERHTDLLAIPPVDALLARLREADADRADPEAEVLANIGQMRDELLHWQLLEHDERAVAEGLRQIYRGGRRRYRSARRSGGRDHEQMHDWRKRVKSLYYALDMLGARRAKATAKLARRADRLGELLGDEHDLWLLASYVQADEAMQEDARALLLELVERRRQRLRERALALGGRVYRRSPERFAARVSRR